MGAIAFGREGGELVWGLVFSEQWVWGNVGLEFRLSF